MTFTIYQVDAFSDVPFRGNPAAVCVLEQPQPDEWMQHVAAEMNLAETAFLLRRDDGWSLRWFTPAVEVDLCGHATLASAHVLWTTGLLDGQARFHTRSGLLTADRRGAWIELDFPATPPHAADPPSGLIEALGAAPLTIAQSRFDYLVELESEAAVRELRPNITALADVDARGIIVTARADTPDLDFVSRFFAPRVGVNEDPVTGSAHCALVPFWSERLGKTELTAFQASARGGLLRLRLDGDRVKIGGQAVTVLRGELV